ncbi:tetratricopeptide repeat protein 39C-like [Oratosquilla oratoria]|uniref:tetratricopeptide repeat protein 39C-like n=1 Tax=Oratosquilla oratoria TaxID=337810 RepID=UPI003F76AB56
MRMCSAGGSTVTYGSSTKGTQARRAGTNVDGEIGRFGTSWEEGSSSDTLSSSSGSQQRERTAEEYSNLAREGIQLMLNNRFTEAEDLFEQHIHDNIHMAMGYCYLTFMNAVMSFEEEKVLYSMEVLRGMERRCGGNENGWFSSVKNIVLGSRNGENDDTGLQLEQQVILADCQVLLAILTFLQQEIGSYVKGGWVLRKAWKVYEHSYAKVKRMYKASLGEEHEPMSPCGDWSGSVHGSNDTLQSPGSWSVDGVEVHPSPSSTSSTSISSQSAWNPTQGFRLPLSKSVPNLKGFLSHNQKQHNKKKLSSDVVSRLMASVSFGYGLFQLCMSLLPPSLLRLVHVLGLQGDRLAGLSALMFTRKSHDMRAPLATLALLWYHTIVRPFFALDGTKVRAGVEAAHLLLQEAQQNYANSALFLFFMGRVSRLQGDIGGALASYRGALQASPQRELQLLALHEVAWCHLLQLNWTNAYTAFANLKKESRWSKSFYAYLAAVCLGASGNIEECAKQMAEVPSLVRRANHSLEVFLLRRAIKSRGSVLTRDYCLLRAYELLYLWNALPSCSSQHHLNIVLECDQMELLPENRGLHCLILAAVNDTLGSHQDSLRYFRDSIKYGVENPDEICVPAFASYELGLLLSANPETLDEGKKLLEEARDNYHGYDFENRLNVRIHAALKNFS